MRVFYYRRLSEFAASKTLTLLAACRGGCPPGRLDKMVCNSTSQDVNPALYMMQAHRLVTPAPIECFSVLPGSLPGNTGNVVIPGRYNKTVQFFHALTLYEPAH